MKFKLLLLSFWCFFIASAQLSGNYTIDKSQPSKKKNYNSFADAIADLKAKGAADNVTFLVKPDTYNEFINIEGINQNSSHTIYFISSTDDKVKILNDAMSMVVFNSSNISFSNFVLDSRTSSYSSVLLFDNASNIRFNNSEINVQTTNTKDLPLISVKNTNNCVFENSRVSGASLFKNTNVSNNSFLNCSFQYTSNLSLGNFDEEALIKNCMANGIMLNDNIEEEVSSADAAVLINTIKE